MSRSIGRRSERSIAGIGSRELTSRFDLPQLLGLAPQPSDPPRATQGHRRIHSRLLRGQQAPQSKIDCKRKGRQNGLEPRTASEAWRRRSHPFSPRVRTSSQEATFPRMRYDELPLSLTRSDRCADCVSGGSWSQSEKGPSQGPPRWDARAGCRFLAISSSAFTCNP